MLTEENNAEPPNKDGPAGSSHFEERDLQFGGWHDDSHSSLTYEQLWS